MTDGTNRKEIANQQMLTALQGPNGKELQYYLDKAQEVLEKRGPRWRCRYRHWKEMARLTRVYGFTGFELKK